MVVLELPEGSEVKQVHDSLGCLIWIVAIALAAFIYYHGPEIAQKLLT